MTSLQLYGKALHYVYNRLFIHVHKIEGLGMHQMERIQIPENAQTIISTSSKGDQTKWLVDDIWVKGIHVDTKA